MVTNGEAPSQSPEVCMINVEILPCFINYTCADAFAVALTMYDVLVLW